MLEKVKIYLSLVLTTLVLDASAKEELGLAMFYSDKSLNPSEFHSLAGLYCEPIFVGRITNLKPSISIQGNSFTNLDRVMWTACETDIQDKGQVQTLVRSILTQGQGFFVSGEFNVKRIAPDPELQKAVNGYVLKLSYFNQNSQINRENEENRIDVLAGTRANGWQREARIYLTSAQGIAIPDALGVLRFKSANDRTQFRQQHEDVVSEIKQFNQRYLQQAHYFYVDNVETIALEK